MIPASYISFFVEGAPAPQGSKKAFLTNAGTISLVESSSKVKPWRAAVASSAKEVAQTISWPRTSQAVGVTIFFYLPRPKSLPKKNHFHVKKPDLDKLIRSTLDGITDAASIWFDDSQVVVLNVQKHYSTDQIPAIFYPRTGAHIAIEAIA